MCDSFVCKQKTAYGMRISDWSSDVGSSDLDRTFVVVETEPLHRFQDRVDGFLRAALAVGVLDAQDELPAAAARLQPAVQRGARAADVQVAGGTGGEAGAEGHGRRAERRGGEECGSTVRDRWWA